MRLTVDGLASTTRKLTGPDETRWNERRPVPPHPRRSPRMLAIVSATLRRSTRIPSSIWTA
jgi:hypothetical protein